MHIIKLNAIDSTNSYLKALSDGTKIRDYTVVVSEEQTNGRGQMGAVWQSEPNKNLTFSVFKDVSFLPIDRSFYISMATSIALVNTLKLFSITSVCIKWPNDILAEQNKIAGILIENVISSTLKGTVIGIGLNINQTTFNNLPRATSMRRITGRHYNLDEILHVFLDELKKQFTILERRDYVKLKEYYLKVLFRKNKPSTFKDAEGNLFTGYILGVTKTGNLQIKIEDGIIKNYAFKAVTLLY